MRRGTYKFELYGASGGTSDGGKGGFGAYVAGKINLRKDYKLYLFIGAEGHVVLGQKTYNSGARMHSSKSYESQGASGCGSTDIRLINSTDQNGLLSQIIVAGAKGGDAGIFNGESESLSNKPGYSGGITAPFGATYSKGGAGCAIQKSSGMKGNDGDFGIIGDA